MCHQVHYRLKVIPHYASLLRMICCVSSTHSQRMHIQGVIGFLWG